MTAKKTNGGKPRTTRSHVGGFYYHIRELARALREQKYSEAFSYALEIFDMIKKDIDDVPPMAAMAAGRGVVGDAGMLADRLEALADDCESKWKARGQRAPKAAGAGAEAFPWAELLPVLLAVLQAIFARK